MNIRSTVAATVLGVAGAGCAIERLGPTEDGAAGGPSEEVAAASQELASCNPLSNCNYSSILNYVVDHTTLLGPTTSEYLCWASRVPSHHSGGGPSLWVQRGAWLGTDRWWVSGTGTMSCVKQCCFSSNGGGSDVRWLSGDFTATSNNSTCRGDSDMWWNDAAAILQGVNHPQMDSSSSNGKVFGGGQTSPVQLRAWYCGTASAYGNSFFVGIPGGGHQKKGTGQYWVYGGGASSIRMARVNDGFCHFETLGPYIDASVAGQSGDRWVKIEAAWDSAMGDYFWFLSRSDPYFSQPEARARCYYYSQNQ